MRKHNRYITIPNGYNNTLFELCQYPDIFKRGLLNIRYPATFSPTPYRYLYIY